MRNLGLAAELIDVNKKHHPQFHTAGWVWANYPLLGNDIAPLA